MHWLLQDDSLIVMVAPFLKRVFSKWRVNTPTLGIYLKCYNSLSHNRNLQTNRGSEGVYIQHYRMCHHHCRRNCDESEWNKGFSCTKHMTYVHNILGLVQFESLVWKFLNYYPRKTAELNRNVSFLLQVLTEKNFGRSSKIKTLALLSELRVLSAVFTWGWTELCQVYMYSFN